MHCMHIMKSDCYSKISKSLDFKTSHKQKLTCTFHWRFLVPGNTQKILAEIWHHFWLKMMVKSGLEKNILKFHVGLQRYLLTCQANSAFLSRFFCTGQQQLWRPLWNFKIIFSRPLFTIIFKPKMLVSSPEILIRLFYEF